MPKRTPITEDAMMTWRTRHIPVFIVVRMRALAWVYGTTEEDIANQALDLGLTYLEHGGEGENEPEYQ